MNFVVDLSEDQRRMVGVVRELTQGEFKLRGLTYMDGSFPWENIRRLAEIGETLRDLIGKRLMSEIDPDGIAGLLPD
jgi:hypothetical protein